MSRITTPWAEQNPILLGGFQLEVKMKADLVIGSNDEDGIAEYLGNEFLLNGNYKEWNEL